MQRAGPRVRKNGTPTLRAGRFIVLRRRSLLNLLTVLSLLVCLAAVVLWVRSHRVGDVFHAARLDDRGPWTFWVRDELVVTKGMVGYTRRVASGARATYRAVVEKSMGGDGEPPFHRTVKPVSAKPGYYGKDFRCCGFAWGQTSYVRPDGSVCAATRRLSVPVWSVVALTAFPFLLRGVGVSWKRLRAGAGLCRACGYDLRATPGRCPECGTGH